MEQSRQVLTKDPLASSLDDTAFVIEDWHGLQKLAHPGPTPKPTPPGPPMAMQAVLINQATEDLTVKEILSDHSKGKLLCSLKPNDKCTVTTDFVVMSSDAAGDPFDAWWGDSSYRQAHVTLDVMRDPATKGYLRYAKA